MYITEGWLSTMPNHRYEPQGIDPQRLGIQRIPRVLIVYKKSSYEAHVLDEKDENYLRLMRERNVVIRKSKSSHDIHIETLETIKGHLRTLRIPFDFRLRYHLRPLKNYDLVLTIGGDGTFLETSHYIENGLLMGINSVPQESVGFFCKTTADTFLEKMFLFIEGKAPIKLLQRLEIAINNQIVFPLALNDTLFANQNPAGTTRYLLRIRGVQEEQKSSGLWLSPAPGSTAATKSAGGKKLPLTSQKIQYVTREPYAPPEKRYKLLKGILNPRESIQFVSTMDDGIIYIDGPHHAYPIQRGTTVKARHAQKPIGAIW